MLSGLRAESILPLSKYPFRLYRPSLLQRFFHARPTLSRGFLRSARAAPVRFEAHGQMIVVAFQRPELPGPINKDRKSTRLNSSHEWISYAVFCLKKKKNTHTNK